jgi:hypothetical protein
MVAAEAKLGAKNTARTATDLTSRPTRQRLTPVIFRKRVTRFAPRTGKTILSLLARKSALALAPWRPRPTEGQKFAIKYQNGHPRGGCLARCAPSMRTELLPNNRFTYGFFTW